MLSGGGRRTAHGRQTGRRGGLEVGAIGAGAVHIAGGGFDCGKGGFRRHSTGVAASAAVVDDRHRYRHHQILSAVRVGAVAAVLQRVCDRPDRRHLTRSVDVLPELRVVRGQIRVAVHAARQIQVARFLGRRVEAGIGVDVRFDDRRGGENGADFAGSRIEDGGGALSGGVADEAQLAALVDARGELAREVLAGGGRAQVQAAASVCEKRMGRTYDNRLERWRIVFWYQIYDMFEVFPIVQQKSKPIVCSIQITNVHVCYVLVRARPPKKNVTKVNPQCAQTTVMYVLIENN